MSDKFPLNGFLAVNKEKGWTSFDAVSKTRSILGGIKVGHAGTLDPNATGLLILGLNKFTKTLGSLAKLEKEYEGEIFLGATSNTDDAEGEITEKSKCKELSKDEIKKTIEENFSGKFSQRPPDFSAVKVGGVRSYAAARKGKQTTLPMKEVEMMDFKILDFKFPVLKIYIKCGSGFYVRSLARDLGEELKCGGYLKNLKRTSIGKIKVEKAIKIKDLSMENAEKHLLNIEDISTVPVKILEKGKRFFMDQKIDPVALGVKLKKEDDKFFLMSDIRFGVAENINGIFKITKAL